MKKICMILALAALSAWPAGAHAHGVIFECWDNGDETVSCQGGYVGGSSAAGVPVVIRDASGAILEELKLDGNSEATFAKPEGTYKVRFEGGEGHIIEIDGANIVQ